MIGAIPEERSWRTDAQLQYQSLASNEIMFNIRDRSGEEMGIGYITRQRKRSRADHCGSRSQLDRQADRSGGWIASIKTHSRRSGQESLSAYELW